MTTKPFETTSNPKPKSLVDDQLKPAAEMHILVGGPYTDASGEAHRYGHTALRIKTIKYDLTYDFGRYGKTSGTFGESGDGILRVWSSFQPYINGEIALNRKTTGFVYFIFDSQADLVKNYFDSLAQAGAELSSKSSVTKKVYKLATDYHALGPNCTTLSVDGAKQAVPKIDQGSDSFNKPEEVLDWKERLALKAKGGSSRLFLPANLLTFLYSGKPYKADKVVPYPSGE